ncbi:MAG: PaaI family thioesterase [Acidobacteriota bacterium]|nr:PaaI family thioesterase [Acidobacteriota bacterium]
MRQSFNNALGLRTGEDGTSVVLDTRPDHQIAPGLIHFAVLATVAEVSAAQSVGRAVVPASIQLQLMRRAEPGRLVGRGKTLKLGRRLAVAEGEVFQNDRLVAKATVTFSVV